MKSGISLIAVHKAFGTEEACITYLKAARWPEGVRCIACDSEKVSEFVTNETEREITDDHGNVVDTKRVPARHLFQCNAEGCRFQFSATSGTIFDKSHLPLSTWFQAVAILVNAKKSISAKQMERDLGVSYRTAWYLCHRIRYAMAQTDKPMLDGKVEMDVTYVGGQMRGKGHIAKNDNKEVVVGIRKRNGDLRFFHASDAKGGTLAQYIRENISEDVEVIFTDDASANDAAMRKANRTNHKKINHSSGVYVMGDIHTNTVESAFSLLKRGIMGTWHRISAKHLPAYLEEMEFRFNRRKRSDLFVDTLRHMVTASVLTFEKLTT